ncbi:MAG: helix-turn-helix domain-containing protein, partial [Rudaea sp.]
MPVSYNEWLRYVLRAEGVDKPTLSHLSGLSSNRLEELTNPTGPVPSTSEIDKIASALNIPKANMDRSLKAMQVYDNLKAFKED